MSCLYAPRPTFLYVAFFAFFLVLRHQSLCAQDLVPIPASAENEVDLSSPDSVFPPGPSHSNLWQSLDSKQLKTETFSGKRENVEGMLSAQPELDTQTETEPRLNTVQTVNYQEVDKSVPAIQSAEKKTAQVADAPKPAATAEAPLPNTDVEEKPAILTAEEVTRRRSAVELQSELADEAKAQIFQIYDRALESLKLHGESVKKTAELKGERERGPELIKEKRAFLERPALKTDLEISKQTSLSELEQQRLAEEELANEVRRRIETWEAKAKVRAERKPQMPAILEKTKQQLEELQKAIKTPPVDGESPALTLARKTDQEALLILLQQQLEQSRVEQSRYEALTELFPLERDELMRKKIFHEKRLDNWKVAIAEARRAESERQAREAKEKLRNTHPALRQLAERNTDLTQQRKTVQAELVTAEKLLKEIEEKSDEISKNFEDLRAKENLGALSTGAGMLLRNQRHRLPSPAKFRSHQRTAQKEITRLQLERMPLQDERDHLGDFETQIEAILAEVGSQRTISDDEIRETARDLLNDRQTYLDALLNDTGTLLMTQGEIDVKSQFLTKEITEYQSFIDERILWIPSAGIVNSSTLTRTLAGTRDIFSAENFIVSYNVLKQDILLHKYLYLTALFAAISVLVFLQRIRVLIAALGKKTKSQLTSNVTATLSALGLTLMISSVWPVLIWLIGWRLTSVSTNDFTFASGIALQVTAIAFWTMEVLRQICRKKGIAETFLKWSPGSISAVHSHLLFLIAVSLPLMFLSTVSSVYNEGFWADSLGRISFIAFCGVLMMASIKMLKPTGQILGHLLKGNPDGLMYRTRKFWYPLSILSPCALGIMAGVGYQYTAEQLLVRLQFTFWLSISIVIAYTIITQWLLAARRQIAMEQARARRAAAMELHSETSGENGGSPVPPVDKPQVDLSTLNQQMVRLLRVTACVVMLSGSWMIWSQVMPALHVFNRIELWSTAVTVVESHTIDGEETLRTVTKQKWITFGNLLFAAGIVTVSLFGGKNLPGLLELSLLQRLPLDHGERNAITTLCRYACVLIGMIVACKTIGIGWSSVQWLVAALTVGLGFGLQEIFANFVSGLIILFERPIRIGDVVTIDNVTGSVSKIQIRATTIIDWDRKEYIVPNKEFVTGRLLNWTLSDKTNRVVINVGVAYGAETDLALEILNRVAQENPVVLNDPAPIASFEGFGNSTLSFNLRVYLPNLDNRLKVITDLHLTIDREFRKAGIEIAFPQMDLHIRSVNSDALKLPALERRSAEANESKAA